MKKVKYEKVHCEDCKNTDQKVTIRMDGNIVDELTDKFIPHRLTCPEQDDCDVRKEARLHNEECSTKTKLLKKYTSQSGCPFSEIPYQ